MGPCKTFNLAGFPIAAAIVPNKEIRDDFLRNTKGIVSHIDSVAYVAAEAAYSFGAVSYTHLTLPTNREV